MKTSVWFFLFLFSISLQYSMAADMNGTWEWTGQGFTITLIMNADGTGKLDDSDITFSVQGDRLIVNEDGEDIRYKFQLAGDKLTLSEGDLDESTVFVRKGASAKGIGARKEVKGETETAQKPDTGIAGSWVIQTQKGPLLLDLKSDGKGSLAGSPFTWQYQQKILILSISGQTIMYNTVLSGDELTLSGGDLQQPATFHRQSGASAQQSGGAAPVGRNGTAPAQDCGAVALAANVTGGCAIRLATPARCEDVDLTGGQSYEFAWTTDGTNCETPYTLIISGNPASEANAVSWKLSTNVEQGITRNGGITYITASDLEGLTSDNGLYHWVVIGYYGSHPDSQTFRVRK